MIGTKVVDTADHIYAGLQGLRLLGQRPGTPGQRGQTLAKGGIESLNESGVNTTRALTGSDQPLDQLGTT